MSLRDEIVFIIIVAVGIGGSAVALTPLLLPNRLPLGLTLGGHSLAGLTKDHIPGALAQEQSQLQQKSITIQVQEAEFTHTLADLGVSIEVAETAATITPYLSRITLPWATSMEPVVAIDSAVFMQHIRNEVSQFLHLPRNASLALSPNGKIQIITSAPGEGVDLVAFAEGLERVIAHQAWDTPLVLQVVSAPADIQDAELATTRTLAQHLLQTGFTLRAGNREWPLPPYAVNKLIKFQEYTDAQDNVVLGLTFDEVKLAKHLGAVVAPVINTPPQNARFERSNDTLQEIQAAIPGATLNLPSSIANIQNELKQGNLAAELNIETIPPTIQGDVDLMKQQFTTLLARGESSFAGSPRNRIHNINVGTARYHGLLIPPGEEFSFNQFLGPVNSAAGYKPELVIKHDKTIPEYGGGLCQVSTTIFRAAALAGLKITERKNHAYAVSYYGKPGFDATIYPGVTDFKFVNDTPSYMLMHAKIDGTRLSVELWGQSDGREVQLEGPFTYAKQPDGAMRAVLKRKITKPGESPQEEIFSSRYRSPKLFPKPTTPPPNLPFSS